MNETGYDYSVEVPNSRGGWDWFDGGWWDTDPPEHVEDDGGLAIMWAGGSA